MFCIRRHVDKFFRLHCEFDLATVGPHEAENALACYDIADFIIGVDVALVEFGQHGVEVGNVWVQYD